MGILASRNRSVTEDVDQSNMNPLSYRYPPKEGNYFANYFIMGGERFEMQQPEAYLFGDNQDLNFLGTRPVPFPYSAPQTNEPTKTLRALINVRKESVRFIRTPVEGSEEPVYTIEFLFDTDVSCSITVYFGCAEEIMTRGVRYVSRAGMQPETFHYKPGAAQLFSQPTLVWSPCDNVTVSHVQTTLYPNGALMNRVTHVVPGMEGEIIPVVIVCQAEEGDEPKQHQATYCLIERSSDSTFVLKALKQKLYIDGLAYLLQDIYGIENKHSIQHREVEEPEPELDEEDGTVLEECDAEEDEEGGGECVICMSEPRDTLILPCRHLCLCQMCADSLRYQANNCPICRAPFRALLQIRALRKLHVPPSEYSHLEECVPMGYEAISLLEALNGLTVVPRRIGQRRAPAANIQPSVPPIEQHAVAAAEQPEETVISVDSAESMPTDAIVEEVESEGTVENTPSKSFGESGIVAHTSLSPTGIASRMGWNRMNNYRRSLGAVGGENVTAAVSPPTIQGPLRRTRSAHARRPPMNLNSSLLGPRGATSPSLRSSGDSCSSADSTRRLVKPAHPPSNSSPGLE